MENQIFEKTVLLFLQTYRKRDAILLSRKEIFLFVNSIIDKENIKLPEKDIERLRREITDAIHIYYQCEH